MNNNLPKQCIDEKKVEKEKIVDNHKEISINGLIEDLINKDLGVNVNIT